MQQKLKQRILESEVLRGHVDDIGDLLVIDYDMLILVVSWAYKDHAQFHHLLYSYQTHVRKAQNMVTRCASYRHYVMNMWALEMTDKDKKKFERGYKKVVGTITKNDST